MRRAFVVLALAVVVVGIAAPLPAQVPPSAMRFVAQDRAANRQRVKAGIEAAIADMSFLIRPFARLKLRPKRFDFGVLMFRFGGSSVTISHDDHTTTSPSDGKRTRWSRDGEQMWVAQTVGQDGISQIFETEDGTLTIKYSFSQDLERATLHAVLKSPKLTAPLKYHLLFVRDGAAATR